MSKKPASKPVFWYKTSIFCGGRGVARGHVLRQPLPNVLGYLVWVFGEQLTDSSLYEIRYSFFSLRTGRRLRATAQNVECRLLYARW